MIFRFQPNVFFTLQNKYHRLALHYNSFTVKKGHLRCSNLQQ